MEFRFEECDEEKEDRGGLYNNTCPREDRHGLKLGLIFTCALQTSTGRDVSKGFLYSVVKFRCLGGHVLTNPLMLTLIFCSYADIRKQRVYLEQICGIKLHFF